MRVSLRTSGIACLMLCAACKERPANGANAKIVYIGTTIQPVAEPLRLPHATNHDSDSVIAIRDVLEMPDKAVWVIEDGAVAESLDPRILVFDSLGTFVRQVGRAGSGAGEYTAPYGMARLKDGRVVVRDGGNPERVLVYRTDGGVDSAMVTDGRTGWPRDVRLRWGSGRADPIRVDVTGATWLPFEVSSVDTDTGSSISVRYVRVRPKGEFMGIVDSPDLPIVRIDRIHSVRELETGGTLVRNVAIPNQPTMEFAWNPRGSFSIAQTSEYTIHEFEPEDFVADSVPGQRRPAERRRTLQLMEKAVAVSPAEQESLLVNIKAELARLKIHEVEKIPAQRKKKPLIDRFRYADDGRLIVWVRQPSVLQNGKWIEPQVIDIINTDGVTEARVGLPQDFRLLRLIGKTVWGAEGGATRRETATRYTIQ